MLLKQTCLKCLDEQSVSQGRRSTAALCFMMQQHLLKWMMSPKKTQVSGMREQGRSFFFFSSYSRLSSQTLNDTTEEERHVQTGKHIAHYRARLSTGPKHRLQREHIHFKAYDYIDVKNVLFFTKKLQLPSNLPAWQRGCFRHHNLVSCISTI